MPRRMGLRTTWFVIWCLLGVADTRSGFAADSPLSLRAGAHAQDITPPKFPISVNGNFTDQKATAAHDPLHARCLVLKNSECALAIVVCDSCMIPRELMDRAKLLASTRTGIPVSHILISATHAHSCPTVAPVFQSEPDQDYVEFLVEQIALGIERANNQLEPARIGFGVSVPQRQLFNRRWYVKQIPKGEAKSRSKPALKPSADDDALVENSVENPFGNKADRIITNPGYGNVHVSASVGLIDPELCFMSVQSRDGRPIALLANYSLHYVGGVPGDVVSADYFGEFAQQLTQLMNAANTSPPFVGIMSNGTSGDVNNVDFSQPIPEREPFDQIYNVADALAQNVAKACSKLEYLDELPLRVREAEIVLGVRKPIEQEVLKAKQKLLEAPAGPLKEQSLIYARETDKLSDYSTSVRVKLQAIRIGNQLIAACPCETFTETGLAIKNFPDIGAPSRSETGQSVKKKNSPFKVFTISLANGYNGYLPPASQMLLGGYETWRARSSYLAADAETTVYSTIHRLLSEVSH